ncbi:hypothetical protein L532_2328 [Bordetella bronchiseptica OSU095]|nr:hypothetical protein L532_2328 [Bordetella bronchiseptica OSU095]
MRQIPLSVDADALITVGGGMGRIIAHVVTPGEADQPRELARFGVVMDN